MTTTAAPPSAPASPLPATSAPTRPRAGAGPARRGLRYEPGIDGLRAVSVLAVLGYHAGVRRLPGGFLGVEVFFAVSGYLITSLLLEEWRTTRTISLRRFWVRRARRLLPALYVLLAVASVWALLFARDALAGLPGDVLAALLYVSNWWQIFQDQSYFAAIGRPPLLRHLWSLAIEEQFYLVFPPLLALALPRLRRAQLVRALVAGALASALLMAVLYEPASDPSFVYYGTWTRLSGLLLGAALATVWSTRRLGGPAGRGAGAVLDAAGVAGLAVLAWSFLRVDEFSPFVYRGGFLLVDLATLVVVAAVVHPRSRVGGALGVAPLRWIGLRSYGLYLWHWPIFVLTRPDLDVGIDGMPLLAVRIGLTFACTEVSYRYVEQPLRHGALGRAWARLRSSTGPARRTLVRRWALAGAAGCSGVVVLAVGLAAVVPTEQRIPGVDAELAAIAQGDPGKPVVPLEPSSTTQPPATTAPSATTQPTVPAAGPAPAPTPPPVPAPSVTAIGDSVMLGAQRALQRAIPGIQVDAVVSRQFGHATDVIRSYQAAGALGQVVVLHLGTNGRLDAGQFDAIMESIGRDRLVIVLNNRVPRPWETANNERLAEGVARWPNARLIDWRGAAGSTEEYWAADGYHVQAAGAALYAELVRQAVAEG